MQNKFLILGENDSKYIGTDFTSPNHPLKPRPEFTNLSSTFASLESSTGDREERNDTGYLIGTGHRRPRVHLRRTLAGEGGVARDTVSSCVHVSRLHKY